LGFIEAVRISGVSKQNTGWIYTIEGRTAQPIAPAVYGDRISNINRAVIYYSEDEFVTLCGALDLAEEYALSVLSKIQAQKQMFCSDTTGA
jgi:hypothetical protein